MRVCVEDATPLLLVLLLLVAVAVAVVAVVYYEFQSAKPAFFGYNENLYWFFSVYTYLKLR